ncbi:hypothetical protein ACZ90_06170 [Streptomyces albus subsp. albus]|nr:hypothetical protein ACZ90_06170 [Streptomyces albus subsp. albus]
MADPVSRTILLLDIERYSDRDDVEQAYLRRMLYDVADRVLEAAGIEETRRQRADRGDSVIELIDANASVAALLRALLAETPVQLRGINRLASTSAQMRLRAVLATGYVAVDAQGGWVGSDLNHACRLLDAEELRELLRRNDQDFALCVSEPVYQGIVQHGHPGVPPERFHHTTVASKNGPLGAWLYGAVPEPAQQPADTGSAGSADAADRRTAPVCPALDFRGADVRVGGGVIAGDNHGISAGRVTGDIHFGSGALDRDERR